MVVNAGTHAYLLCEISGVPPIDEQDPPLQVKFSTGFPYSDIKTFCTV